jgi:hypothetical protein
VNVAGGAANLRPIRPGETLALKHGAYSALKLAPRAEEIADEVREIVPARTEADEPTIRLLALTLAQVEAAAAWVAEWGIVDGKGKPQGILRHLGTMTNTAARLASALGMTPTSRAALGLDLVHAQSAAEALDEYLRTKRGADA